MDMPLPTKGNITEGLEASFIGLHPVSIRLPQFCRRGKPLLERRALSPAPYEAERRRLAPWTLRFLMSCEVWVLRRIRLQSMQTSSRCMSRRRRHRIRLQRRKQTVNARGHHHLQVLFTNLGQLAHRPPEALRDAGLPQLLHLQGEAELSSDLLVLRLLRRLQGSRPLHPLQGSALLLPSRMLASLQGLMLLLHHHGSPRPLTHLLLALHLPRVRLRHLWMTINPPAMAFPRRSQEDDQYHPLRRVEQRECLHLLHQGNYHQLRQFITHHLLCHLRRQHPLRFLHPHRYQQPERRLQHLHYPHLLTRRHHLRYLQPLMHLHPRRYLRLLMLHLHHHCLLQAPAPLHHLHYRQCPASLRRLQCHLRPMRHHLLRYHLRRMLLLPLHCPRQVEARPRRHHFPVAATHLLLLLYQVAAVVAETVFWLISVVVLGCARSRIATRRIGPPQWCRVVRL